MEIEIPQYVKNRLSDGERVVAKVRGRRRADFIATDRRVIRVGGESDCTSLQYERLTISLRGYGVVANAARIVLAAVGALLVVMAVVMLWGPTTEENGTTTNWGGSPGMAVVALLAAVFCLWLSLVQLFRYYQIEVPGMDGKELKKWVVDRPRWFASKVDQFAQVVRDHTGGASDP